MSEENNEIENIKKQYQEFLHIISHDFNAPLRHIKEFSYLLVESLGNNLKDDEKTYIDFIQNSVKRLQAMQTALLELSRIHTHTNAPQKIESKTLIDNAIKKLGEEDKTKDAVIEKNSLPVIEGDTEQLECVFYHLIANALKFHSKDNQKKISIIGSEKSDEVIFEIEDNGIGIKADQAKVVFNMFRSLHASDQYGGCMGTGLTISKEIIERHGGHIWVEPAPESSTKVIFTLPKQ